MGRDRHWPAHQARGEQMDILALMVDKLEMVALYAIPFTVILGVVVFIHELGHFLVGRWCGVGVKAFSIGFGPELFGFTDRHETRWKVCAIPLGGYVKFAGDANGASVPDFDAVKAMTQAEREQSFILQPLYKRAAIVLAGPMANFLLAIAIFAVMFMAFGRMVQEPYIGHVQPGSAAERAGFLAGDAIRAINGQSTPSFDAVQRIVSSSAGESLAMMVERAGRTVQLTAVPELRELNSVFGKHKAGVLGVQANVDPAYRHYETYGPIDATWLGVKESWRIVDTTLDYLGRVFVGRESADQISGLPGIVNASGQAAKLGIGAMLMLTAVLSVSIGLINLFPVPLLDGGHLMFYAIEALVGRPLSEKTQEIGFRIGFALVVMLMLFATWNDIVRLTTS
jgi:regulator of sigma E protease